MAVTRMKKLQSLFCGDGEDISQKLYKKFDEKYQIDIQNGKQIREIVLVYNDIKQEKIVKNMRNKLIESQIINLAIGLVKIVIKIKENNMYFGGFAPERICHSFSANLNKKSSQYQYQYQYENQNQNSQGTFIFGGEYWHKKCTVSQYLSDYAQIREELTKSHKYQPPQIYSQKQQETILGYSSDLFVIGCIIYQLFTGQYPFPTKQALLQKSLPAAHSYQKSELTKQIYNKLFQPAYTNRVEPEQLLHILELERSRGMFNSCQLYDMSGSSMPGGGFGGGGGKNGIFDNFQEFIMKCTTETQGWLLHYCQNSVNKSNQKYLELILNKVAKKNQKANKLINLVQKICAKPFKQQNPSSSSSSANSQQDNTATLIKASTLLLTLLQKLPFSTLKPLSQTLTKISSKIVSKKPANPLLTIMFKIVAFKISFLEKFPQYAGNFYLKVEGFVEAGWEGIEYVGQYCGKVCGYLTGLGGFVGGAREFQNTAIVCLCNQLYNVTSILLYSLMSTKKDISLKLPIYSSSKSPPTQASIKKLDSLSSQLVKSISKLCSSHSIFGCHQLYSVLSDYYQYQEELCLMYEPVLSSFQYFYIDKGQYKGLSFPKNYGKVYGSSTNGGGIGGDYGCQGNGEGFFQDFAQEAKYNNRKPIMMNRLASIRNVQQSQPSTNTNLQKQKSNTNSHKIAIQQNKPQSNRSQHGSSGQKFSPTKNNNQAKIDFFQQLGVSQTERKPVTTHDRQFDFFQAFMSQNNVNNNNQKKFRTQDKKFENSKSNNSSGSGNNKNNNSGSNNNNNLSLQNLKNSSQQTCSTLLNQNQSQDQIITYETLKKAQKIKNKIFQKPQVDQTILLLYNDICNGLKLQQLISVLNKNKKMIIDPNKVLFQKVIGSGSAGQVYIGKYQQSIVAIKKVKISTNQNALKQFERQVLTYLKIKYHPSLVSMIGLTKFNEDYFLLTEFCDGGSLFDLLHKRVKEIQLSWRERINIALDIAKGMEVLHYMNPPVIHRDLKSLNVFMIAGKEGKWIAKVADFGLSRSPDTDMMTSALGTLHWMAPQLLSNKQYSLKVDVYSFAVVLWQICSRRTPYHNLPNQMAIVKHVVLDKGRPLLELINPECPKQLANLMIKCWDQNAQNRPYFPEIVVELGRIRDCMSK